MTPNWITTAVERARSRRPVTLLTLIGVLLLPVVIGGILVAALYNPVDRLESLTAAVVNEDEPVTVDGQTVPLGRQLTAGLVDGSDDLDSNLTWTLSNADDAADGLADGTYAAVITIPENFSAAALSTRPGETPEQATIEVTTPPDSLIVDDAITAQVANAAATTMGTELSTVYLENVFLGFTTLSDQLGTAADGAQQLADGAAQAADGAAELPGGIAQLADGNTQLASGASQLADGAGQLADGATSLQSGLTTISDKTGDAAAGAQQLADGVTAGAQTLEDTGLVPDQVSGFADTAAASTAATAEAIGTQAATLGALAAQCAPVGSDFCLQLATAAADTGAAAQQAVTAATDAGTTQYALDAFDTEATASLAGQFREIGSGVGELAGGLTQLAGGIDQSAAGAGQLATGATGVQDGAAGLADGASQLASGATQAADGATSLADGVAQLADGTDELAGGLATAADSLPSYSDAEATDLATVVADPVSADGVGTSLFGASAIPLLTTLALWFGGLGTFIALQAVSRRALTSRQPSAVLALRAFAPAAGLGALQGLLVAGVVQLAASYSWAEWSVFALVCVVAGIAFAAVNQALVAVFGGAGRWVSALIGVFVVATGVVSTVPGVLSSIAALLPTGPAYNGMVAALTSATGLGAALTGLVVWTLIALGATVLVVARRRSTSAQALLKATPLTA